MNIKYQLIETGEFKAGKRDSEAIKLALKQAVVEPALWKEMDELEEVPEETMRNEE